MLPATRAARARQELIRRERLALRDLTATYGLTWQRVRAELAQLEALIAEAQGQDRPAVWLRKRSELERFLLVTRGELLRYTAEVEARIRDLQSEAVGQAVTDSRDLISDALGPAPSGAVVEFAPPRPELVGQLVGFSADGQPLGMLLSEVAGTGATALRDELLIGVARGKHPREIARNMRRVSDLSKHRSELIARTEALRAYRETTRATFDASPVVTGWTWQATLDVRTCAMCWAMSGTVFPTERSLDTHPGCRCALVPVTRSWRDLGFDVPDQRPPVLKGPAVFADLPPGMQRQILGPGKYRAYTEGLITLQDLVQPTRSRRWGPGRRERSLRAALS